MARPPAVTVDWARWRRPHLRHRCHGYPTAGTSASDRPLYAGRSRPRRFWPARQQRRTCCDLRIRKACSTGDPTPADCQSQAASGCRPRAGSRGIGSEMALMEAPTTWAATMLQWLRGSASTLTSCIVAPRLRCCPAWLGATTSTTSWRLRLPAMCPAGTRRTSLCSNSPARPVPSRCSTRGWREHFLPEVTLCGRVEHRNSRAPAEHLKVPVEEIVRRIAARHGLQLTA